MYDLQGDRRERTEVSGDYPDIVRELTEKLYAWKKTLPAEPKKSCLSKERTE